MRRFSFANLKNAGVTDTIIGICLVMLGIGTVIPAVPQALCFIPPLGLAEPYRFITSAFLHSGFWHFAFNMLTLYLVGTQLERELGRVRYAALFLISACAGNVGVLVWAATVGTPFTAVVGASGAVFGLFGALLAFAGVGSPNFKSILVLVLINLAYGFLNPGISWQSHVAGFIGGYALAWLWHRTATVPRRYAGWLDAGAAMGIALVLAAIAYGSIHFLWGL
ncbi:MAG: rhomboid family intramembrane serine protease [Arcanobacterium sp.]|nr:rhomboid family intramembrane serine protease [Arcanobacterium sp.]MDY5589737.1 rhomboid family intramembrane serine protease [Arcanobacterium sp.]